MFSSEFFEISKNSFFTEYLWTTASERKGNNVLKTVELIAKVKQ